MPERELLGPLLPSAGSGRPRAEDRRVINGMVYKIRTGVSRRDLPERYSSRKSVYTCFRRYAIDGVFTRAPQQIQARADAAGDIDWPVQIDSTLVRAHQHAAATGRKRGKHRTDEPDDHALGRSRGGLTTKIHLACDGRGRPRCRPDHVIAGRAYSSRDFRAYLRKRGIGHTIPEKSGPLDFRG
ncbi:IS5 family transposase [Streptomyces sp. NPDC054838]